MYFLHCVLMLVFVTFDETLGFIVRGPSGPLVVPLGGSAILLCYVETPLDSEEVKVVWSRTDSGALVHLYQDGESRPESQHKDYHGRARFFTDQIQHGNFSLRLDNLTAGDKGVFRCKIYSQQAADQTLVEIKQVEFLLVSGSDQSMSAYDGEDVTLNCSVDSHIALEDIEVSWIRTNGDVPVLLFQNNETLPEAADEQYRDRAEFFTVEISKGNFSLRLKSVRTEDKGVYMGQVFAGGLTANVTVVLVLLGFSELDIIVLILCIFAPVFTFLICCLVYSKSGNQATRLCLFLSPFITMMLASVLWCITQGSLYEMTSCCMLYILGPLRLLWVAPLATDIPATILNYVMTAHTDHAAFTAMMYSVLLVEHFENISTVFRTASIGLLVLLCLLFIIQLAEEKLPSCSQDFSRRIYEKCKSIIATCSFSWLPSLQLSLLLYSHSAPKEVFIITALPVLHWVSHLFCNESVDQPYQRYQSILIRLMMIVMTGDMLYLFIILLTKKDVDAGPICVAGIIQALSVMTFSEVPVYYKNVRMREFLFLYGSAGLVLANSVGLITEVIMKAVRGVRLLGDLRGIVFSSEWLFTVALLISSLVASCKPVNTRSSQVPSDYNGTSGTKHSSTQMAGEPHESETLREAAGNSEEHQEEEIC